MSANAASLQCPICQNTGTFQSAEALHNRLISVATYKLSCPVCQEEVVGLDKLTIHLFTHVKQITFEGRGDQNDSRKFDLKSEDVKPSVNTIIQKKSKPSVTKNKPSTSTPSAPVKFVKIYPKLPIVSVKTVSPTDNARISADENSQLGHPLFTSPLTSDPKTSTVPDDTTCDICGLQFVDKNILKMHRSLIHNIEENTNKTFTRYNCHLCPKNFKMRGSLMVHLRVAHFGFSSSTCDSETDKVKGSSYDEGGRGEKTVTMLKNEGKQWQCEVCHKCFTTKYFLKKHKRLHTGETPYACTQCSKTFTFQQSYHKHLLYHNDEKPHTCNYCGRAFKELSTLHNHQRIHTGEKPFSCETCGKCFRQRVSYLVHRRIHTGVMPYKCTACEKSFRYKVSQRTHKCQAQPPGTVIRQTGELVEKLKKKHVSKHAKEATKSDNKSNEVVSNTHFVEVSEANAELVRTGAKLSLEDTESENFTLIPESSNMFQKETLHDVTESNNLKDLLDTNFEQFMDSFPVEEKNVPSPSDIFKNLCLSPEEENNDKDVNFELLKDFWGLKSK